MELRRLARVAVLLVTLTTFVSDRIEAATIYATTTDGPDAVSKLYRIDSVAGVATLVGFTTFQRISAIEFGANGVLYGTAERNDGSNTPVLITINTSTGLGTEVGPTGISGAVTDLAFRTDGTLFAFDAISAGHRLATINTSTGAAAVLGPTSLANDGGNGIEFSGGALYHIGRDDGLHTLNQTTGVASGFTPVTYVGDGVSVLAMDTDPVSSEIYAAVLVDAEGGARGLATVDLATATVTSYFDIIDGVDGITFLPEPATSTLLLFLLGLIAVGSAARCQGGSVIRE